MSDTPLTDALDSILTEREIDRALDFARDLERELAAAQAEIAALLKTKMTLAELGNMISMANTITFSKDMHRATPEAIQKELLACINEWLRGDDKATRIKREKNK